MNFIDVFLVAVFLFFIGSCSGWVLEVFFRRFCTAKKWINPGFLTGPYLPLYGFGVVGLFAISLLPIHTGTQWLDALIIILIMGVVMTAIEYIAGLIFIKGMKIRLWDYSDRWGNVQGIICPLFSFFWLIVSALFYFFIDKPVIDAITWFVHHIEFAFVVGMLAGVFLVDLAHALDLSTKIRSFAKEHSVVVNLEKLKVALYEKTEEVEHKHPNFVFLLRKFIGFKDDIADKQEEFVYKKKVKAKSSANNISKIAPADVDVANVPSNSVNNTENDSNVGDNNTKSDNGSGEA